MYSLLTTSLKKLTRTVDNMLTASMEISKPFMDLAAILACIAHPVFYLIWSFGIPQPYENIWWRALGSLTTIPVILGHRWAERFRKYLPAYFHLAVIYNIPIFFSIFLINNNFSQVWLFSTVGAVFVLTLLVDLRMVFIMFWFWGLFWIGYLWNLDSTIEVGNYVQYLVIFLFPLLFGTMLNRKLQSFRLMQSDFEKRLRKITNENTRITQEQNVLLSHFLSNTIVNRLRQFQRKFDLDTAIHLMTRQEERFCAIMEADIRNFTKMFGSESEMMVAQLINRCFTEITSIGQDLAVIKPVGDSIFMYCDDQTGRETTVNNILALAILFVNSVERVNDVLIAKGDQPLNFGVAVHAGKAIYGNLASDTLIDPTIIGLNVNKTARLEELTKSPEIIKVIGRNAVIVSEEAAQFSHEFFKPDDLIQLNLDELGVSVRDFQDTAVVYALPLAKSVERYKQSIMHIDQQRGKIPDLPGGMTTNSYLGVPYFYDMEGIGPSTSWTIMIDVSSMPYKLINDYAIEMLQDLNYTLKRADGHWLILNTGEQPGQYDETAVERLVYRIITELDETRKSAQY